MKKHIKSPYNECLFFAIEQICKYIQEDYISKYNQEITHDEFRVMDIINYNPDICQRDLAKLALRDCVKIGRILNNLEKRGLLERFNDMKGNRLVKKMKLTLKGENLYFEILNRIEPETNQIFEKTFSSFSDKERLNNLEYELFGRIWEFSPQNDRIEKLKLASSHRMLIGTALPYSISAKSNVKKMMRSDLNLREKDNVGLIDGFLRLISPEKYEIYRK